MVLQHLQPRRCYKVIISASAQAPDSYFEDSAITRDARGFCRLHTAARSSHPHAGGLVLSILPLHTNTSDCESSSNGPPPLHSIQIHAQPRRYVRSTTLQVNEVESPQVPLSKTRSQPCRIQSISGGTARSLLMSILQRTLVQASPKAAILHPWSYLKKSAPVFLINSKRKRMEKTF
jgi:hypothetical protein